MEKQVVYTAHENVLFSLPFHDGADFRLILLDDDSYATSVIIFPWLDVTCSVSSRSRLTGEQLLWELYAALPPMFKNGPNPMSKISQTFKVPFVQTMSVCGT